MVLEEVERDSNSRNDRVVSFLMFLFFFTSVVKKQLKDVMVPGPA